MICPTFVEHLETRIAPAALSPQISADGKSATFVDADGDVFTVTTSKGTFTANNFTYEGDTETGFGYLQKIDLGFATFGKMFQGAKLTVTVDQFVGDGFADVGFIDASGIDLKQAIVAGDLVRIDVGDSNFRTPAIARLQTDQFGFHAVEDAGISDFISHISGKISVLDLGAWEDGAIQVTGGPTEGTLKYGSIGRATIGSMHGRDIEYSASLITTGPIGTLTILGNLEGGDANNTGLIQAGRKITSLTVAGSIIGKAGILSGAINADESGLGSIGSMVVGGNIEGGTGAFSGAVVSTKGISSLEVLGDLKVGEGHFSGSVHVGTAKSIAIRGEFSGGSEIGGIYVEKVLKKLTLGSTNGESGPAYVIVPGSFSTGMAIEKITVTGSLEGARILAGYGESLEVTNPNARIGKITIGENLVATDIVAGISSGNDVFGDEDDFIPGFDLKPTFLSKIASIVVGGAVLGTEGGTDQFGIVAERIDSMRVAGVPLVLGKKTVDTLQLGEFEDYDLREVSLRI